MQERDQDPAWLDITHDMLAAFTAADDGGEGRDNRIRAGINAALAAAPTWVIEQYVTARRAEEE